MEEKIETIRKYLATTFPACEVSKPIPLDNIDTLFRLYQNNKQIHSLQVARPLLEDKSAQQIEVRLKIDNVAEALRHSGNATLMWGR